MENSDLSTSSSPSSFKHPRQIHNRLRKFKDQAARHIIAFGGISVIITIVLIFFYLLYVVLPMFIGADIHPVARYKTDSDAQTLYIAMEEQAEIAMQVTDDGNINFFNTHNGELVNKTSLDLSGQDIKSIAASEVDQSLLALGLSNGHARVFKHEYKITFNGDTRVISPFISYPMGEESIELDDSQQVISRIAIQDGEDALVMAVATEDSRLLLATFTKESSLLDDEVSYERDISELPYPESKIDFLLLDKEQSLLYTANEEGHISVYDISDVSEPEIIQTLQASTAGETITSFNQAKRN
jgi:phosphate transport system permease protein